METEQTPQTPNSNKQKLTTQIYTEDIFCIICKEVPDNAHTASCCGTVICKTCKDNLIQTSNYECPSCKETGIRFDRNMYLIKLINKFPSICKYDCGHVSETSEMKLHQKKCLLRNYKCKHCSFSDKKDEFILHVLKAHDQQIIDSFEETQNIQQTDSIDVFSEIRNRKGNLCHLGETNKFYCGKQASNKCGCCDGRCGPTGGCNCLGCMELDLKYRNIALKQNKALINGEGRISYYKNNTFHCGVKSYDIICKNDQQCRQCQGLQRNILYFKSLLE